MLTFKKHAAGNALDKLLCMNSRWCSDYVWLYHDCLLCRAANKDYFHHQIIRQFADWSIKSQMNGEKMSISVSQSPR